VWVWVCVGVFACVCVCAFKRRGVRGDVWDWMYYRVYVSVRATLERVRVKCGFVCNKHCRSLHSPAQYAAIEAAACVRACACVCVCARASVSSNPVCLGGDRFS